jgi:hypothetical protein
MVQLGCQSQRIDVQSCTPIVGHKSLVEMREGKRLTSRRGKTRARGSETLALEWVLHEKRGRG